MTDPGMICAVCRRVLDTYVDDSGARYQHSLYDQQHGDGHEVVPVAPDAGNAPAYRCDFCQEDVHAPSTLQARPFEYLGNDYSSDWAMCDVCADLIRAGDWAEVTQRSIAAFRRSTGAPIDPLTTVLLKGLHETLRAHVTGGPIPHSDLEKP